MTTDDDEQLRMLAIFHFILGGLSGCCSAFPLIYVGIGVAMLNGSMPPTPNPPPPFLGWFFVAFGSVATTVVLLLSIALVLAGLSLRRHRHRVFCVVISCLNCLNIPLGTILGVLTLIVLNRPAVQAAFDGPAPTKDPNPWEPELL